MSISFPTAGSTMRELREQIGLTMREVELASTALAESRGADDYVVTVARLHDYENKGVIPTIHRMYALSVIYRADFSRLMKLFGIDLGDMAADLGTTQHSKTHRVTLATALAAPQVPLKLDPGFNSRTSSDLVRMIESWGPLPMQFLQELSKKSYRYAYIGSEDYTMWPLLLPGSFIQIDPARKKVEDRKWNSELERPIYLVETREGTVCCWCSVKPNQIVLQPHTLSPVSARVLGHPQDAEVLGQVVGVAMRIGERGRRDGQEQTESPVAVERAPKEERRR